MGISFCSCFAGGIFIGAALLDLLPEVEEIFAKVQLQVGNMGRRNCCYSLVGG